MQDTDNTEILWRAIKWRHRWVDALGSITSHDVAVFIARHGGKPVTMKDIFLSLGCSYLRVTQVIRDLEAARLVEVVNSTSDRRVKEVLPTKELFQLLNSFDGMSQPA